MQYNKKLLESKIEDSEVTEFLERSQKEFHPFTDKWMKGFKKAVESEEIEVGQLKGTSDVGATAPYTVYPTLEIFNAVIRGFARYMDDSFVRKYITDKVVFKVPLTEYIEGVGTMTNGQFPHTEKMIDYATVDLSDNTCERGGKVAWTRALLEDITFDVQAEMMEGLGHAIAKDVMDLLLTELLAGAKYESTHSRTGGYIAGMPLGAKKTISNPITWDEFLAVVGAVDTGLREQTVTDTWGTYTNCAPSDLGKPVGIGASGTTIVGVLIDYNNTTKTLLFSSASTLTAANDVIKVGGVTKNSNAKAGVWGKFRTYGPADFALVSADIYWQLLNIIQMTNVLYEGSTDPVNRGVIKLALGTTIVKQSLLPKGTVIALNSEKAIALVTRRNLKIEPVLFPVWNEYGFIGSIRLGTTVLYPGAVQIGQIA